MEFGGADAELLLEEAREVAAVADAYHVAYLLNTVFTLCQILRCLLQPRKLYQLMRRHIRKTLDLIIQSAPAYPQLLCQEIHIQLRIRQMLLYQLLKPRKQFIVNLRRRQRRNRFERGM